MHTEPGHGSSGSRGEATLGISMDRIVSAAARPDEPFCIAVLGDFRGRGARPAGSAPPLHEREPVEIDRDNFDGVLARFAPELRISLSEPGPELAISFRELDHFHPDSLYERVPLFRALREMRHRLGDPATVRDAVGELDGPSDPRGPAGPLAATVDAEPGSGSVLDRILDAAPAAAPSRPSSGGPLADYIRRIVEPHLVRGNDPRQPDALARVDAAIGDQMRALLHHPEFQALEALWRGVFFLVRRLDTGTRLKVYLFDVTRAELDTDLGSNREAHETALNRMLSDASARLLGSTRWALLVGHYTFGPRPDELRRLRRIARLANLAAAPWISAAEPRLVGCPSFGDAPDPDDWSAPAGVDWQELQQSPDAGSVGLVLPRFLLRLPYGEDTEPCDSFGFEEAGSGPDHEDYLWGNPALLCALLLGRSFASEGWSLRPGGHLEVGNLPLHLVRDGSEVVAKPCAEALMTERAAARILDAGVMPLASLKDRDAVRLVRFQSIASPAAALAGRWSGAIAP